MADEWDVLTSKIYPSLTEAALAIRAATGRETGPISPDQRKYMVRFRYNHLLWRIVATSNIEDVTSAALRPNDLILGWNGKHNPALTLPGAQKLYIYMIYPHERDAR